MMNYVIRPATAQDADALTECIEAAYSIYETRKLDLPPVSEGIEHDIAAHHVWIAEIEEAIVGGLVLIVHEGFAHLANVAVDPACAGCGVGRSLVERAEQECRTLGLRELRLTTHTGLPENIQLYEHLGWREVERSGAKVHMSKQL